MRILALPIALLALQAWAAPAKVSVKNFHLVSKGAGEVYRSMSPAGHADELAAFGITDVVIFKNEVKHEVQDEIAELKAAGIRRVTPIPFRWKDFESYEAACRQTVQALKLLKKAHQTSGRKALFHCTAGEDRTGMLAGLFEMLTEGAKTRDVFKNQMCKNGYAEGDRGKPANVVAAIHAELTPIFAKMATLVEKGDLTLEKLDPAICRRDVRPAVDPARLRCR